MNRIWMIARRELASYFDSLIAYVMLVIFLGLSGFFTWLFGNNVFVLGQATLQIFFNVAFWTLFFFVPAISMRSLSEEYRAGTIELLGTKAITDWQIVVGKYLACLLLVGIALAFTLPYYFSLTMLGSVDHGAVWGGYLGLLLLSSFYAALGVFASSTTSNQIVAFLVALSIGLVFHILLDMVSAGFTGGTATAIGYLSARTHFDSLSRGVIDSRDLIYFLSLTFLALLLAQAMLNRKNWKE